VAPTLYRRRHQRFVSCTSRCQADSNILRQIFTSGTTTAAPPHHQEWLRICIVISTSGTSAAPLHTKANGISAPSSSPPAAPVLRLCIVGSTKHEVFSSGASSNSNVLLMFKLRLIHTLASIFSGTLCYSSPHWSPDSIIVFTRNAPAVHQSYPASSCIQAALTGILAMFIMVSLTRHQQQSCSQ
jgi:hypothetical protein